MAKNQSQCSETFGRYYIYFPIKMQLFKWKKIDGGPQSWPGKFRYCEEETNGLSQHFTERNVNIVKTESDVY